MASQVLCPEKEKSGVKPHEGIRVCFVCSGNTCRSPMAQAWLNHVGAARGYTAVSCGLATAGLEPISHGALAALHRAGVPNTPNNNYESHLSRPASLSFLEGCDRIIGMTQRHAMALLMAFPQLASRISAFPEDIPDPFGQPDEAYEETLSAIACGIAREFALPPESAPGGDTPQTPDAPDGKPGETK